MNATTTKKSRNSKALQIKELGMCSRTWEFKVYLDYMRFCLKKQKEELLLSLPTGIWRPKQPFLVLFKVQSEKHNTANNNFLKVQTYFREDRRVVCLHVCQSTCVEVRGQLIEVWSLHPPWGLQELNSGCRTWYQDPTH